METNKSIYCDGYSIDSIDLCIYIVDQQLEKAMNLPITYTYLLICLLPPPPHKPMEFTFIFAMNCGKIGTQVFSNSLVLLWSQEFLLQLQLTHSSQFSKIVDWQVIPTFSLKKCLATQLGSQCVANYIFTLTYRASITD